MKGKIFLYLACITITFDSFPFNIYGLGSPKPLYLVFLTLFFMINILKVFKIKVKLTDNIAFYILFVSWLITLVKAKYYYANYNPLLTFTNLIIGFIIVYLSILIVINFGNIKVYEKIKKYIIIGYVIALIVGIMQFITIHLNTNIFNNIYPYILRDLQYVNQGRIHFTFGEPSYIGGNIFLILIPLYKYISNKNKKLYIMFVAFIYILGISSFSMQLLLDTFIFVVFLLLFHKRISMLKKMLVFIISIFILFSLNKLFIQDNYFKIDNVFYRRLVSNVKEYTNFFKNDKKINDQSLEVRITLAKTALKGIEDNPILGSGLGYFGESYKKNINDVYPYWQSSFELVKFYNKEYSYSYIFYFNIVNEAGILGVVFLIMFFWPILVNKKNPYVIMSLYFLIQANLFGNICIILMITVNKYIKRGRENENNDGYTCI